MAVDTQGTITRAGAAYLSTRISQMAKVNVVNFVLANVPGVDETTPADWDFELLSEHIVSEQPVYRLSHTGENAVVYSLVMDSNVGNFDFNWYGLVTDTDEVIAFAHIPLVSKRANVGQIINRNFIIPFTAAKALTGAEIPAESWQFDFTDTIAEVTVSLQGPTYLYSGDSYTYTINDWDVFSTYSVAANIGTATLGNAQLTLEIPEETPEGECLLTVIRNGSTRIIPIRIGDPIVAKPVLIAPVNGAPNIKETPTLTISPFQTFPKNVDTQVSADWELYDANDNLVLSSYDDTTHLSAFPIAEGVLTEGGYGYKWRGRQKGAALGDGEWSEFSTFSTEAIFMKLGVVIDGDIVVGQYQGYWYLVAPSAKRKKAYFYGKSVNFNTTLGGLSDNAFVDPYSGESRTQAILSQYPDVSFAEAFLYVSSIGCFIPNRAEMKFIFDQKDKLNGADTGPYSLAAIASGTLNLSGAEGYENYGDNSHVMTSTESLYNNSKSYFWAMNTASNSLQNYVKHQYGPWVIPARRIPV
jgi:hypothetical protein